MFAIECFERQARHVESHVRKIVAPQQILPVHGELEDRASRRPGDYLEVTTEPRRGEPSQALLPRDGTRPGMHILDRSLLPERCRDHEPDVPDSHIVHTVAVIDDLDEALVRSSVSRQNPHVHTGRHRVVGVLDQLHHRNDVVGHEIPPQGRQRPSVKAKRDTGGLTGPRVCLQRTWLGHVGYVCVGLHEPRIISSRLPRVPFPRFDRPCGSRRRHPEHMLHGDPHVPDCGFPPKASGRTVMQSSSSGPSLLVFSPAAAICVLSSPPTTKISSRKMGVPRSNRSSNRPRPISGPWLHVAAQIGPAACRRRGTTRRTLRS